MTNFAKQIEDFFKKSIVLLGMVWSFLVKKAESSRVVTDFEYTHVYIKNGIYCNNLTFSYAILSAHHCALFPVVPSWDSSAWG